MLLPQAQSVGTFNRPMTVNTTMSRLAVDRVIKRIGVSDCLLSLTTIDAMTSASTRTAQMLSVYPMYVVRVEADVSPCDSRPSTGHRPPY